MGIWSTGSDDEGVIRSTKAPKVGSDLLPLPLLLALAIFVIVVLLALLPAPPPHVLFRAAQFSIQEQLISRNVERFRGELVFEAHTSLFHPTLGSKEIKKKKKSSFVSRIQGV